MNKLGINGSTASSTGVRVLVSFYTDLTPDNSGKFTVTNNTVVKRKAVPCPVCGVNDSKTEVHFENGIPVGGHCITCDSQFIPTYTLV